jgi:hypothetical protein
MALKTLTHEQQKGVKVSVMVVLLVLALFVAIMVAGSPIVYFKTEPISVAYTIAVYVPVIVVCLLALRRLAQG